MTPPFRGAMRDKYGRCSYVSAKREAPALARRLPSATFYSRLAIGPMRWLCRLAAQGRSDDAAWVHGSDWAADIFEDLGGVIDIRGLENVASLSGPCVFIANHMSTLETFLLPGIIRPMRPVTFVVKRSLVEMPFFGPVMRSRDPIAVDRKNPREDLKEVLEGGRERLANGISIVVFPQSSRSPHFDRSHFNTIGVKLAAAANVPALPLALKTDAWGMGNKIRELGPIRPDLPVRFNFGEPLRMSGKGKNEHVRICDFIESSLNEWQARDGAKQ